MIKPNETFNFTLSYPTSTDARDPGRARLEVTDHATGLLVLQVDFSPEQFMKLLHSTYLTAPCWFNPRDSRGRIGMRAVRATLPVPKEYTPSKVRRNSEKGWTDDTALADGWAWGVMLGANHEHAKWDEYRLVATNEGWVCHFVRYEAKAEAKAEAGTAGGGTNDT